MTRPTTRRQLEGLRVIDMTRVLAGPLTAQMLGDLGAEVIKVEHPSLGDESRFYGPPFLDPNAPQDQMESAIYLCANRNKKAITVDFTSIEGQDLLRALVAESDVVIENYRVGTLAKYRLDYESLRAINSGLIYCSVTGYGQTGPSAKRSGYDAIFQAEGGLMHSIGYPDGHPGAGPMRVGLSIADVMTGLYADIGIIAALYKRDAAGGAGEHIDMSLLESCISVMSHHAMHYLVSGELPPRRGNASAGGGVPSGMFRCADGDIVITVGNDAQYRRFCDKALERPDLAVDPRFSTNKARVNHRDELFEILGGLFTTRTMKEWIDRMVAVDLAAGQVNTLADVFANEQVKARGVEIHRRHRNGSELRMVANPIHFRENPIETYEPAPKRGEHNRQVFTELLGLSEDEVSALERRKII
jgi:crotonobetainyl-CoA:carnitine CoA-transferase CaiB-like acyl-CoA transferase